jgi:hypothetical protein
LFDETAVMEYLSTGSPEARLRAILKRTDPLFPAEHSWMVTCEDIASLNGSELRRALGLRDDPPYIVFELSVDAMRASGVTVRASRSVDAVPAGFTEWDPEGLPTGLREMVDGDVPQAALTRVRMVQ